MRREFITCFRILITPTLSNTKSGCITLKRTFNQSGRTPIPKDRTLIANSRTLIPYKRNNKMEKMLKPALLFNAKIYVSGESDYNWIKFSPRSGTILDMGRGDPPKPTDEKDVPATVVDARGRRVFPGFHDAHLHVASFGELLSTAKLHDCKSIPELQDRVKTFISQNPSEKWVLGVGWNQEALRRYPNREDLDAVCSDKPVVLKRVCFHIWAVNSKMLELAGECRSCNY